MGLNGALWSNKKQVVRSSVLVWFMDDIDEVVTVNK